MFQKIRLKDLRIHGKNFGLPSGPFNEKTLEGFFSKVIGGGGDVTIDGGETFNAEAIWVCGGNFNRMNLDKEGNATLRHNIFFSDGCGNPTFVVNQLADIFSLRRETDVAVDLGRTLAKLWCSTGTYIFPRNFTSLPKCLAATEGEAKFNPSVSFKHFLDKIVKTPSKDYQPRKQSSLIISVPSFDEYTNDVETTYEGVGNFKDLALFLDEEFREYFSSIRVIPAHETLSIVAANEIPEAFNPPILLCSVGASIELGILTTKT